MKKKLLACILFILAGLLLFCGIHRFFGPSNYFSEHAEMMMSGYYEQPEDTLDVVLVGNSHVYKFWQGAYGWLQNGIASLAFSTSDMPESVYRNMAEEALKTQSPKVLVLDATAFARDAVEENNRIYLILDNMKFSGNYMDTVDSYCSYLGISGLDRLSYYLPFVQFHSRWSELNKNDFIQTQTSYLNSCYLPDFLSKRVAKGTKHVYTRERRPVAAKTEDVLRDLLDWCLQQETEILFMAAPLLTDEEDQARINYVGDIIAEYGLPFLNFNTEEWFPKFDFKIRRDYQDLSHNNVNGAWKFTNVFGQYLMDTYDLTDHRGEDVYADWDEKADRYMEKIGNYFKYSDEIK